MSGIFIFSWLLFVSLASGQEPDLQIDVLSVGQADAQLIFTKDKVLLIDIGGQVAGPKKQFEYVFSKLKELTGKDNIDYFVVTHYHTDHLGNLYANSSKGFGLWGLVEEKGVTIGTVIDRGDDVNFGSPTSTYNHYKPAIDRWLQQGKVHNRAKAHLGDQQILLGNGVKIEVVAVNGNEVLKPLL